MRKFVCHSAAVLWFVSPSAQTMRNCRGPMDVFGGKDHCVRFVKLSVRKRPSRLTVLLLLLNSSIHGSRWPKLSLMLLVLIGNTSLIQIGGNSGKFARAE